MPHYVALIHKDADCCYGVSFPDWPGVITAGDTIDEALQQAAEVLTFAAEDWEDSDGVKRIPSLARSTNYALTRNLATTRSMP
jgi:predicted RNase H-like HicB family nuclease